VRTRRSTASTEGAKLTGQAHGAEREKGTRGATTQQLANRAREAERGEGRAGGRVVADRRVRLSSGAGARPGWAELGRLGCFLFFFFSEFSNSFSISFL
jgi:hypothetical protein